MAYMSPEHKAELAPTIKAICKKHGVKASIAVRNHMTLVLNIKSGKIDFIGSMNRVCSQHPRYNERAYTPARDHIDVNPHWYKEHFDGAALAFLSEVIPAMHGPRYFDESDSMTDYFHCSHYIDVNVGRWNAPYVLEK